MFRRVNEKSKPGAQPVSKDESVRKEAQFEDDMQSLGSAGKTEAARTMEQPPFFHSDQNRPQNLQHLFSDCSRPANIRNFLPDRICLCTECTSLSGRQPGALCLRRQQPIW